jgi:hypothetical protein
LCQCFIPVILAIWEAKTKGSPFKTSPCKMFVRPPSQQKKAGCHGMRLSSQLHGKHKIWGLQSRLALAKAIPCLQNNQSKKGWVMGKIHVPAQLQINSQASSL